MVTSSVILLRLPSVVDWEKKGTGDPSVGAGNRASEIHERRHRRQKRKKRRTAALLQAVKRGRTRQDRVRIAQEFHRRAASSAS
jgi:hypothetical protein